MKRFWRSVHDISWTISKGMTVYKDKKEKRVSITPTKTFEQDAGRESRFTLDSHTGTHVDAPSHMLATGAALEAYTAERLVAPCTVIATGDAEAVTAEHLQHADITAGDAVLFKTRNSLHGEEDPFDSAFTYVTAEAATALRDKNVAIVGIDALGIERGQKGHPTHHILLGAGILILEGLRLANITPGRYLLVVAPLKIKGVDAAPARALLIEIDENNKIDESKVGEHGVDL
ncbi:cyclase family protein [Candidatus Woesearchaeota archaeon]|nr:MAG: cyclase family protein [Candidatus Woesearchaeota archaeon]